MKPISVWRLLVGHDGQRPMGILMGFLMITESQDLGLTSHQKGRCFIDSIVSPSLYWGIRAHIDNKVSTPCWPH